MENNNLEYSRRPLPLELLVEMHKCLPLADAINVLVNVPSFAFVDINKPRMLRTIRQLKMSLNGYIGTLVGEEAINRDVLAFHNNIKWKPELNALLRYGGWLTSKQKLLMMNEYCDIIGAPKNFVEELLLHLSNSRSTQTMLKHAGMNFPKYITHIMFPVNLELYNALHPIPAFIKQLLLNTKHYLQQHTGDQQFFEPAELKIDDDRIFCILDGKLRYLLLSGYELTLFVANKFDRNIWFKIYMRLDLSKQFIYRLEFTQWKIESFDDVANFIKDGRPTVCIKQNGSKLELEDYIYYNKNPNLDMFLRRGTSFTQIRRFKMEPKRYFCDEQLEYYIDLLINYISDTKHPEDFLESIDINLSLRFHSYSYSYTSKFIKKICKVCHKGIGEGRKFTVDKKNFHILSAKTTQVNNKKLLEFTLANLPSNGEYLFDVNVELGNGRRQIDGIKIQKRKIDEIAELNCEDRIENEKQLGKKRKALAIANDDDGKEDEDKPTCSSKIMKK